MFYGVDLIGTVQDMVLRPRYLHKGLTYHIKDSRLKASSGTTCTLRFLRKLRPLPVILSASAVQ